jgi:toxin ParE1/3/4
MTGYRLTPDAQSDLIQIRAYTLEQWGSARSQKYLSQLRETIRLLSGNHALGKRRQDAGPDVLSFSYASHVIYYVVRGQQLVVFAVLHKRMVPLNHVGEREIT